MVISMASEAWLFCCLSAVLVLDLANPRESDPRPFTLSFNVTQLNLTVGVDLTMSAIATVLMGRAIASGWQGPPNFRE